MKVVFRVDSSIEMGIGHVMRCLTLADALRAEGAECHFVCREHPGNLLQQIAERGHQIHALPIDQSVVQPSQSDIDDAALPVHAPWLGCDWMTDARQTAECIGSQSVDWLIVDHYALDNRWEKQLRGKCRKIMVIDDLADRSHDCDILLDQNLGTEERDYSRLLPEQSQLLIGPQYSLLRPEFARLRTGSLKRRGEVQLKQLLITMGGVDKDNATGQVLEALQQCPLPANCRVSVIMGSSAPWLEGVKRQAEQMVWPTEVVVNVADMAQRMAKADLAISASGSTSWERCCLGLPTLLAVLADNQLKIGEALNKKSVVCLLGRPTDRDFIIKVVEQLTAMIYGKNRLSQMSLAAAEITDGRGCQLVVDRMLKI